MTQGGDGDQPHRACTDHRNGVAVRDLRPECGVDTAGDRLHQDGEFIAHPVGDLVKLAGVGDELGRPRPPVVSQKPVWMPGSRSPVVRWR